MAVNSADPGFNASRCAGLENKLPRPVELDIASASGVVKSAKPEPPDGDASKITPVMDFRKVAYSGCDVPSSCMKPKSCADIGQNVSKHLNSSKPTALARIPPILWPMIMTF